MRIGAAALVVALGVVLAGCGGSAPVSIGPGKQLVVGAVEDAAKWAPDERTARARVALARRAGYEALVFSAVWTPPLERPRRDELARLRRAVRAAVAEGVMPIVAVYQFSSATPVTDREQAEFAAYAASIPRLVPQVQHEIVGNEPNLNLFWLPQFGPGGADAAAASFERLLARSYDAIKAAAPSVEVICCGLAPHGGDRPGGRRPTHSPTTFIRDLGAAYRESGRTRPLLDAFSIHVYGENSAIPPDFPHPHVTTIGIADYDKLERLLRGAFGGDVPIVYGEYGADTRIPAENARVYTGAQVASKHPVDAATQGRYYVDAIRLAACQPLVQMLLFFHVSDEPELSRLQTGVFYADHTAKPDLEAVAAAARKAESGQVECPP